MVRKGYFVRSDSVNSSSNFTGFDDDTGSNRIRDFLHKWGITIAITAILSVALCISVSFNIRQSNITHNDGVVNGQTADELNMIIGDNGIDLRINPNTSDCNDTTSCMTCKTEITPYLEPKACENETIVKNGSCFLCEDRCYTLQELLTKVRQKDKIMSCSKGPVHLDCCILSAMGNLDGFCGKNGLYNCYYRQIHVYHNQQPEEPICNCQPSNLSKNCQKPYTQLAECKCFKLLAKIKLINQEQTKSCDNVTTDWQECQVYMLTYNCLCTKSTGNIDNLPLCPSRDTKSTQIFTEV